VGAETPAGLHPVVVDDPQAAVAHVLGVAVLAEGKTVPARQPAELGPAALGGGADAHIGSAHEVLRVGSRARHHALLTARKHFDIEVYFESDGA
jgi:hypothetical protein